jgi:hypothetical protein
MVSPLVIEIVIVLMLLLSSGECFTGLTVPSPSTKIKEERSSTQLKAVSIPVPSWGGAVGVGSTTLGRRDRIQHVLARANSRTGVPVYTPPSPTSSTNSKQKKAEQQKSVTTTSAQQQQESLPFALPQLSEQQVMALQAGEIVQEQSEMGRQGSGFVVQDVQASEETIWNHCLLDVESYVENIHTVRGMRRTDKSSTSTLEQQTTKFGTPGTIRACFTISKFHLQIGTVFNYQPHDTDGHYMELTLDNDFSNAVLQKAKGIWYTQRIRDNVTRLWLLCDLTVSPLLPPFIIESAATKAMPHASQWIRPTVAKAQEASTSSIILTRAAAASTATLS